MLRFPKRPALENPDPRTFSLRAFPEYLIIKEFGLKDHDYYGFWGLNP